MRTGVGVHLCLLILIAVGFLTSVHAKKKKECEKEVKTGEKGEKGMKGVRCQKRKDGRNKHRKPVAPVWKKGPPKDSHVIAREGTDITLNCAIKGRPFPSFSWLRNEKSITPETSTKYKQKRSRLRISSLAIEDTGTYTCIAKNSAGLLNFTYSIKVLENMPLKDIDVVDKPENQTAQVGDTVTFLCRSRDFPMPQVYWARKTDSQPIQEVIQHASNKSDVLVLRGVNKSDTGTYMCFISNGLVHEELSARLTVIEKDENLPFEPRCSLHVRYEHFKDRLTGCQTSEPLEKHYCMGSCGRSYYEPQVILDDGSSPDHVRSPCKCCVGVVSDLRIVNLKCPLGKSKKAFYTLLSDCVCQQCSDTGAGN